MTDSNWHQQQLHWRCRYRKHLRGLSSRKQTLKHLGWPVKPLKWHLFFPLCQNSLWSDRSWEVQGNMETSLYLLICYPKIFFFFFLLILYGFKLGSFWFLTLWDCTLLPLKAKLEKLVFLSIQKCLSKHHCCSSRSSWRSWYLGDTSNLMETHTRLVYDLRCFLLTALLKEVNLCSCTVGIIY